MRQDDESFIKNFEKLRDLIDELPDSLSKLIAAKQKAKEVFRRMKLLCKQYAEEKPPAFGYEQITALCVNLLRVYALEPNLFPESKSNLLLEIAVTFKGEKQSAEMLKLIAKIESRLDLVDLDDIDSLITQGCQQIFSDDFDLHFIREHQHNKVAEALQLLEVARPDNQAWQDKLSDSLFEIDSSLVECIGDRIKLQENLAQIETNISSKILVLKFDEENRIVSFRNDYSLSPGEFKLAKYLWQRHQNGDYWVPENEISRNRELAITSVRDILRSGGEYRPSYKKLFDFKGSGIQKAWRIKF